MGSIEAVLPFKDDLAHYSVSKTGVIALTRALADEPPLCSPKSRGAPLFHQGLTRRRALRTRSLSSRISKGLVM